MYESCPGLFQIYHLMKHGVVLMKQDSVEIRHIMVYETGNESLENDRVYELIYVRDGEVNPVTTDLIMRVNARTTTATTILLRAECRVFSQSPRSANSIVFCFVFFLFVASSSCLVFSFPSFSCPVFFFSVSLSFIIVFSFLFCHLFGMFFSFSI